MMKRSLFAALLFAALSLMVAGAAGLGVASGPGATGEGDIVSPPLSQINVEFFADTVTPDYTRLDYVRVTLDRGSAGSDPEDTTPGDCAGVGVINIDCYDLYVQLKDGAGNGLGTPKVIHNFANGIDGAAKFSDVSFFGDNVSIADIESIAFTICGRHESGDRDFACATPP